MCAYERAVMTTTKATRKRSTDMAFNETQVQDFLAFIAQSTDDGMHEQRPYRNVKEFLGDCFEVWRDMQNE
jgi:hypothetical protein